MAINMHKLAVMLSSLAIFISLNSCSNADYRHQVIVNGAKGRFFIGKTGTSVPLSDDVDTVDYEFGSKRINIFSGTGGETPSLIFDKLNGLIIISYCGGRIDEVKSSFSDTISTSDADWMIYRTQVINNSGFTYGKLSICN